MHYTLPQNFHSKKGFALERFDPSMCFVDLILRWIYVGYTLFPRLYMQHEEEEWNQVNQQKIQLNSPSTILSTSDEEIRHLCNSSNDNSSIEEFQSI